MGNVIIVAALAVILIVAIMGSIKHIKGEGGAAAVEVQL